MTVLAAALWAAAGSSMPAFAQAPLSVPFVPQTEALCGGAAAAMVLRYWGVHGVYADSFAPLVDRSAGGIHTSKLDDALMSRGWETKTGGGDLPRLAREIEQGRPVIVLIEDRPGRFHYVVVIAASEGGPIVLHDPAKGAVSRHGRRVVRSQVAKVGSLDAGRRSGDGVGSLLSIHRHGSKKEIRPHAHGVLARGRTGGGGGGGWRQDRGSASCSRLPLDSALAILRRGASWRDSMRSSSGGTPRRRWRRKRSRVTQTTSTRGASSPRLTTCGSEISTRWMHGTGSASREPTSWTSTACRTRAIASSPTRSASRPARSSARTRSGWPRNACVTFPRSRPRASGFIRSRPGTPRWTSASSSASARRCRIPRGSRLALAHSPTRRFTWGSRTSRAAVTP